MNQVTPTNKTLMLPPPPPTPTTPSSALVIRPKPGPVTPTTPRAPPAKPLTSSGSREVAVRAHQPSPSPVVPATPQRQRPPFPPTPRSKMPAGAKSINPSPRRRSSVTPARQRTATPSISSASRVRAQLAAAANRSRASSSVAQERSRRDDRSATVEQDEEEVFWLGAGMARGRDVSNPIEIDSPPHSPVPSSSRALERLTQLLDSDRRNDSERADSEASFASFGSRAPTFRRDTTYDTSDPRYGGGARRDRIARGDNPTALVPVPAMPVLPPIPAGLVQAISQAHELLDIESKVLVSALVVAGGGETGNCAEDALKVYLEAFFGSHGEEFRKTLLGKVYEDLASTRPQDQESTTSSISTVASFISFLRDSIYNILQEHLEGYPTSASTAMATAKSKIKTRSLDSRKSEWYAVFRTASQMNTRELRKASVDRAEGQRILSSLKGVWTEELMEQLAERLRSGQPKLDVSRAVVRDAVRIFGDLARQCVEIAWS